MWARVQCVKVSAVDDVCAVGWVRECRCSVGCVRRGASYCRPSALDAAAIVAELVADAISSRACVLATVVSLDEAREPNAVAEDEGHG